MFGYSFALFYIAVLAVIVVLFDPFFESFSLSHCRGRYVNSTEGYVPPSQFIAL